MSVSEALNTNQQNQRWVRAQVNIQPSQQGRSTNGHADARMVTWTYPSIGFGVSTCIALIMDMFFAAPPPTPVRALALLVKKFLCKSADVAVEHASLVIAGFIVFDGSVGGSGTFGSEFGDIAIDDISVLNQPCSVSLCRPVNIDVYWWRHDAILPFSNISSMELEASFVSFFIQIITQTFPNSVMSSILF